MIVMGVQVISPRVILPALSAAVLIVGCTSGPTGTQTPDAGATVTPTAPPPVVVKISPGRAPATLDPLFVGPLDVTENDLIENLFAGLTRLDSDTGQVEPLLAKSWETSGDGLTWRVTLRDDVFWVRINPDTSQMEKVRPITAADVVYAVRRACRTSTGKAPMLRAVFLIKGCGEVNRTDPATLTDTLVEQTVGARVLNDITVEFALTQESAYFPTVLAMPVMRPLPADLIDKEKDAWTQPDKLWTSGAYAVQPGTDPKQGYTLVANIFWPFKKVGNVDGVQVEFGDPARVYAAWQGGDLALVAVPGEELARAPFGGDARYRLMATPGTTFFVTSYDTPPLDNADVRRALSLALDREAIIKQVLLPNGQAGIPALALVPPGSAGAPDDGSIGKGHDPDAAKAELASAGYSGCRGLPQMTLLVAPDDVSKALGEEAAREWTDTFGCPNEVFKVEQKPFIDMEAVIKQPPDPLRPRRAGLIALGWQADYPDTYHWLADIVGCRVQFPGAYLNQTRQCDDADQRISSAANTADDVARAALYRAVEEAWFGGQGEMPVIPLYFHSRAVAVAAWLTSAPTRAGPLRFDEWVVDASKKP